MVTASEQPSLPGRSSMFPQSGCLSSRTSASVRDTGRKHLHARHAISHQSEPTPLWDLFRKVHAREAGGTHGGISPTKGTDRGDGGARVGVRVLLLDLSLSTTSFSICSWPGSRVRQDGTFSWIRQVENYSREERERDRKRQNNVVWEKSERLHQRQSRGSLSTAPGPPGLAPGSRNKP